MSRWRRCGGKWRRCCLHANTSRRFKFLYVFCFCEGCGDRVRNSKAYRAGGAVRLQEFASNAELNAAVAQTLAWNQFMPIVPCFCVSATHAGCQCALGVCFAPKVGKPMRVDLEVLPRRRRRTGVSHATSYLFTVNTQTVLTVHIQRPRSQSKQRVDCRQQGPQVPSILDPCGFIDYSE